MDKYKNFSTEDFLHDEFFNQWVIDPFFQGSELWESWLEKNAAMAPVVEEARAIILAVNPSAELVNPAFYKRLKTRIDSTIQQDIVTRKGFSVGNWLKVAAIVTGLIVAATILYPESKKTEVKSYSSNFGETKKVLLPDGSNVVLNANSFLEYKTNGDPGYREVWVRGEGFFSIKHIEDRNSISSKFIVHTKDVDVEVKGTEFNVNSTTGEETEVLLTKGKVRLSVGGEKNTPVDVSVNERVKYNSKSRHFNVDKVIPGVFIAWMDHKFILEKTTLEDVGKELYKYYGKEVSFQDPQMLTQRFSGTLELQDEETLLKTLSVLLGVLVNIKDHKIIIHAR
ncbi:MAG TPA: FecR domain-containing protein [Segetibacter sp.]